MCVSHFPRKEHAIKDKHFYTIHTHNELQYAHNIGVKMIVFDETLYGITKAGATYEWRIYVTDDNAVGTIHIERGLVDGKKHLTTEVIKTGKNIGKVNETTAVGQAIFNAESKRNKKLDDGYAYTVDASQSKFDDLLKPMLAQSYDKHSNKIIFPCYVQPKLDGIRCLAQRKGDTVTLLSRQGKVLDLVPHINQALIGILEEGECTDGELYVHGWEFQRVISAIKKTSEDTPLIEYHIYDFPDMNDKDAPFHKRFRGIRKRKVSDSGSKLRCVDTHLVHNLEELMQYEEAKIAEKYEGIMARNGEGKYLFGYRSVDLQKVKRFVDAEYKVIGFTEGSAVEMGAIVFVCETPDGQQFSVRPTGTHEERKEWFLNGEAFIGKMLTVKYQELSIDGVPRFPVGLHFREDWDMGGK